MCRQAATLVQKDDEKKLLLAAVSSMSSIEAIDLIKTYLDDDAVKEEASAGVVDISTKLLQGKDGTKAARQLIEPLDKVVRVTTNAELTGRAKKLLEQAQSKAAAK
jgi:hypothetical protein